MRRHRPELCRDNDCPACERIAEERLDWWTWDPDGSEADHLADQYERSLDRQWGEH